MSGRLVFLGVIASVAGIILTILLFGPRRLDPDVIAGIVVGVLLGGTLDAILPVLVRSANRVLRVRDRDGRR